MEKLFTFKQKYIYIFFFYVKEYFYMKRKEKLFYINIVQSKEIRKRIYFIISLKILFYFNFFKEQTV